MPVVTDKILLNPVFIVKEHVQELVLQRATKINQVTEPRDTTLMTSVGRENRVYTQTSEYSLSKAYVLHTVGSSHVIPSQYEISAKKVADKKKRSELHYPPTQFNLQTEK